MRTYSFTLAIFLIASCTPKQKQETSIDHYSVLPSYFSETLKAHGGLDKWRSFKTLEYDLLHDGDSTPAEHYTLDLLNRKDLTVADSFKIGFDGKEVWVAPNKGAFKGRSARFYHNLYSYFLTIPFIVSDPGVIYSNDTLTVDGKLYDVINVNFETGIGDADKDAYKLLINPDNQQMEKLLYTVTYYSGEAHENYNALSYEDWTDVNGLRFPTKLVGYKYSNGTLGEKRYEVSFINIELKEESPNQDIFKMPTEAEIDSLKTN
ncbi:MAG: hypothetical protein KDC93_14545 [Cyclobacteriaceae bacterium]|nr:hypothetical protein [Cyclobacteriaceae bacterium]